MKINLKKYENNRPIIKYFHSKVAKADNKFKNYQDALDIRHFFHHRENKVSHTLIVGVSDARSTKRKHKTIDIWLDNDCIANVFQIACSNGFRNYGLMAYIFEVCRNEHSFNYLYHVINPLIKLNSNKQYSKWRDILKWAFVYNFRG